MLGLLAARLSGADTPAPAANKAEAYYNFSMGHVYSELAAQYGNRRAAELLIANGAKLEEQAWIGGLYLHAYLLRQGLDVPERGLKLTPLAVAAASGFPATTATLIKHGADVNAKVATPDVPGKVWKGGKLNVLWVAISASQDASCTVLLMSGAELPERDVRVEELRATVQGSAKAQENVRALMAL